MAPGDPFDADIVRTLDAIASDWNTFDLDRYIGVYTEDATYITRDGTFMRGREEIRRGHEAAWAGPLRLHLAIEPLYVRAIGNDHVLAHARLMFHADADGAPADESNATVLFVRSPNGYRVQAAQTTAIARN